MNYIDSRSKVFGHLDRLSAWQEGGKPAPVTIEWDLSNRCALGCMDCHFAHTHTRGPWVAKSRVLPMAYDSGGDLADTALVFRALGELKEAGVQAVVWSGGGEPTTHPDWVAVIERAAQLGLKQGMYTFGGLLSREAAVTLGERATWVVVSLDAANAADYATEKHVSPTRFNAAIDGIQRLALTPAVVGVSFLLHHDNWRKAHDMLALAREAGATYATFRPAIRTSPKTPQICHDDRAWITEALSLLQRLSTHADVELDVDRFIEYRDWKTRGYSTCYGVRLTANITPDGRVWLCPQRRGVPDSLIGDLRVASFREVWDQHPGKREDLSHCRVMCRLHLMNQTLNQVYAERPHGAFL